jgi:hypothetical protein
MSDAKVIGSQVLGGTELRSANLPTDFLQLVWLTRPPCWLIDSSTASSNEARSWWPPPRHGQWKVVGRPDALLVGCSLKGGVDEVFKFTDSTSSAKQLGEVLPRPSIISG